MAEKRNVEKYKVDYFSDEVSTKDKMLKDGRPVKKISFVVNDSKYTIEYDYQEHNYWTREDGCVQHKTTYKDGVRHGKYVGYELTTSGPIGIDFYPRKAVEGHYINGKKTGWWYYYGEDGSVDRKMFVNDKDITAEHNKANNKGNCEIMQAAKRSASQTL